MGDYTAANLRLAGAPKHIRTAVRDDFRDRATELLDDLENDERGTLDIAVNEIACGSASEMSTFLDALIEKGLTATCPACGGEGDESCLACAGEGEVTYPGVDFAYSVSEDPKYEWLGDLWVHVPGMALDYNSDCDSDGTPVVRPQFLLTHIEQAETLEGLRAALRNVLGQEHLDAFKALFDPPEASATEASPTEG